MLYCIHRYNEQTVTLKGAVLYWHFVDIVWIAVYGKCDDYTRMYGGASRDAAERRCPFGAGTAWLHMSVSMLM